MGNEKFSFSRGKNELKFEFSDDGERIYLTGTENIKFEYDRNEKFIHALTVVFDGDQLGDRGNRYVRFGEDLRFSGKREIKDKTVSKLYITEESPRLSVETEYALYDGADVFSSKRKITNKSDKDICLEQCSAFTMYGFFEDTRDAFIYKPLNSNWNECQWRKISLYDEGVYELDRGYVGARKSVMSNKGSQSSKEFLPMGILERKGRFFMWQIMSDSLWHSETGIFGRSTYLNIGGGAYAENGWLKTLRPGETYETVSVQCTFGDGIDEVVRNMTDIRRINRELPVKQKDAVIFNEFMHCSWADPNEERTRAVSREIEDFGIDYYVLDASWHDETCDTNPTHMIGNWQESETRFPSGLKTALDGLRACGFKVGLWVEIQSVGIKCSPLPLGDEAFFTFGGKKTVHNSRYHVDFRNPQTIVWADGVMERIIGKYEIDYIKIDYNQFSYGTDYKTDNMAAALEEHSRSYMNWLEKTVKKYPDVVFESCSSGGQSINPLNLSVCDIMSTSDQESHTAYPYIAANIGSAILPEQAAVWCYPRTSRIKNASEASEGDVIINMVNPMFSRIHLAGKFYELDGKKLALVKEGLAYYKKLSALGRDKFYPVFPCGFASFGNPVVTGGIKCGNKLFVSVYKLDGEPRTVRVDLSKYGRGVVKTGYPVQAADSVRQDGDVVNVVFGKDISAVIIEYELI